MKNVLSAAATFILLLLPASIPAQNSGPNYLTFHGDRQRLGWNSAETALTPAAVSSTNFGPVWNSPQFESVVLGGRVYPPHLYASPLYVESVTISAGSFAGRTLPLVFAATSNGYLYAINASGDAGSTAGSIVWSSKLTNAIVIDSLDGGMPMGVMGTPIIDLSQTPPRLYVASDDASAGWQVFAIDITSGKVLPGWPLNINNTTLAPLNRNGPTTFQPASVMSQRGALNLSPDGSLLYVPFGAYSDGGAGWMVAVNTLTPSLASAFAGGPSSIASANGGMWASGGPAVDAKGSVYATTGNGPTANTNSPGYWGQSVLVWNPGAPLSLSGTYTPWNYCQMDNADIDLAGGAPVVIPDLPNTSTPHLLAFGGKQGNEYLLDRDNLPGNLVMRQACSTDSSSDRSLLAPGPQPQFNARGPMNVFGPYSDTLANLDYAKGRSTPAFFRAADATNYLYATGSSKASNNSSSTTPPCVVKLKIVTSPGTPAYLSVAAAENTLGFLSPGSPIVTSNGSAGAVVWVLVANVLRSASLVDGGAAHPILYALDPNDLHPLFVSTPSQLNVGGKYNTPAFGRGTVFVGTDRIQAFGISASSPALFPVTQINSGGSGAGNYISDNYVTGGNATSFSNSVDTSGVPNPAPQAVYQTKRTGQNGTGFSYKIPGLTPGAPYVVRLHFCESLWNTPAQRQFNVAVNGTPVLTNFDIFQSAGGIFKAVTESFTANASSAGDISVVYTYGSVGNPLSSGIEILSKNVAPPSGISINAGGGAAGKFLVDTDVVGGNSTTFGSTVDLTGVTNPAPLAVYQSKRTSTNGVGFTYTIPNLLVGHTYTVRLHFADDLSTGPGKRLFNVAINGNSVLTEFDVYAAVGKTLKAVIREFSTVPNSSGQIQVQFTAGTAGNALLNGIEVVP